MQPEVESLTEGLWLLRGCVGVSEPYIETGRILVEPEFPWKKPEEIEICVPHTGRRLAYSGNTKTVSLRMQEIEWHLVTEQDIARILGGYDPGRKIVRSGKALDIEVKDAKPLGEYLIENPDSGLGMRLFGIKLDRDVATEIGIHLSATAEYLAVRSNLLI